MMYRLVASCRQHDLGPRTHLRGVLLRVGKVSDVRELTPHGWKQRWAPLAEAHRASIVERVTRKVVSVPRP